MSTGDNGTGNTNTTASSAGAAASTGRLKRKNAAGNRSDPGWDHGTEIDSKLKTVKCRYCDKIRSGGITRHKHHLAGTGRNAEPCSKVPLDVQEKFLKLLGEQAEQADAKQRRILQTETDQGETDKGPMGKWVTKHKSQGTMNQYYKEKLREEVCAQICRFFYTSAISFNAIKNPEFKKMVDLIGKYGMGLKIPSYNDVRVKYLKAEVESTLNMIDEFKEEWKKTGCTIMSDGWTDRKRRSICNFLVNSPKGTVFLTSVDTSHISKTADKVFEMLDEIVERVGEENVVQIVTDNASNYKAAGDLLMAKRKRLYWTPCAAHCIDLMLEDLEKKMDVHKTTIQKGRKISTYIYTRTMLLSWMREYTEGKELIRPAVTRFATAYLTLKSLHENQGALMNMFCSEKWRTSRFAKTKEGKAVAQIIMDSSGFWPNLLTCLKAALPLVKVLRLVDSDGKPAMPYIYEHMNLAKDRIKQNFNNVKKNYMPILKIIDERWESQLSRPLHAAAYYLNPAIHYTKESMPPDIKLGLYACLDKMVPDKSELVKIHMQLDRFKSAKGLFGDTIAVLTRSKKSPADWWDSYGDECSELQKFAIRVLSLTCSSSGCERNWSTFELVHSKRRNRLQQEKMNDLVFVMYNIKLKERQLKRDSTINYDLDDMPSDDEWITEKEDPALPQDKHWLRNLDMIARTTANLTLEDNDAEAEVESMARDISEAFAGGENENDAGDYHEHDDDLNYHPSFEEGENAPSYNEDYIGNHDASCIGSSSRPSDEIMPDAAIDTDNLW